jgi:CRISPR/Cas system-associated endonuclease Cas1
LNYLSKIGVVVHFISDNYSYFSTLYPLNSNEQGGLTIKQAIRYLDLNKRMKIAVEIVKGKYC